MKTTFVKAFFTVVALTIATVLETYTINLMNEKDDLICVAGILLSFLILPLLCLVLVYIWLNNNQKQQEKK